MQDDQTAATAGPPRPYAILLARSEDGWIVQVGVEGLRRFSDLDRARAFAAAARDDAAAAGSAVRLVDLSRMPSPPRELLEDGQEEVFAREEVEAGAIEHNLTAGEHPGAKL